MLNYNTFRRENLLEPVCRNASSYFLLKVSALRRAVVYNRHKQKAVGPHTTALEDWRNY